MKTNSAVCSFAGVYEEVDPCQEVRIGFKEPTCSRSCWRLRSHWWLVPRLKSPGTHSGAPISADEQPRSFFGVVRTPSRTHGSSFTQLGPVSLARRADLRWR